MEEVDAGRLSELVAEYPKLFVLTGAGCSTSSGIPDYRDEHGGWKRKTPVQLREFLGSEHARRRYWARSLAGWPSFSGARPGRSHRVLVELQRAGYVHRLVTQNVDGLHSEAGLAAVIDLHGRNDRVVCIACRAQVSRDWYQGELVRSNPTFAGSTATAAPDGDADLEGVDVSGFVVPACGRCGGIFRPDVVFFGDSVPRDRVTQAYEALAEADALLAVGTSLMVYSGFRFCRSAAQDHKPIFIVNRGRTRADELATARVTGDCADVLEALLRGLNHSRSVA